MIIVLFHCTHSYTDLVLTHGTTEKSSWDDWSKSIKIMCCTFGKSEDTRLSPGTIANPCICPSHWHHSSPNPPLVVYIAVYLPWHDDISGNAAPSVPTNPLTIRAKSLTKCNRRINRTKRIKPTSRKAGLSPLPKKRNRKLSTPQTVDTWWEKLETAEKPKINAIEWDKELEFWGKRTWNASEKMWSEKP